MNRFSTLTPAQRTAFGFIANRNPKAEFVPKKTVAALVRSGLVEIVDVTQPHMFTTFAPRATKDGQAEYLQWLNRKQDQPF